MTVPASGPRPPPIRLTGATDHVGKGPFRLWEHTHAFEERPDGTLICDTVLYRMPYGPPGEIARRVLDARDLERIFDYRRDAVARLGGRSARSRLPGQAADPPVPARSAARPAAPSAAASEGW